MAYKNTDYETREQYLESLARQFDVDLETVEQLSSLLGPSEDFDGLISSLEDLDNTFC